MVQCHRCGYTWDYSGDLGVATCPNCQSKTNVEEREGDGGELA